MRITGISVIANDTQELQFDLSMPDSKTKYIVRSIIGIDAEELIPKFYGFSKDGTKKFYDFKLKQREIVMRIVLNPRFNLNETYSEVRDAIYRAISATRTGVLELQFQSGASTVARIYGYMTKLEVSHFSNVPEIQLTIQCNDSLFRGLNPIIYEAADLSDTNPVGVVDNESTAPHGFSMQLTFTASIATFTIQDKATDPEWEFKIVPSSNFLVGDILYFSSEFNHRQLYIDRSSTIIQLMDKVDPNSVWPTIFPTFNEFHFNDIASFDWNYLQFYTAYWGV
jgi:hypothetical protein